MHLFQSTKFSCAIHIRVCANLHLIFASVLEFSEMSIVLNCTKYLKKLHPNLYLHTLYAVKFRKTVYG